MKDILFITFNQNGSIYVCYRVLVKRGIKRKNESKADEVLINGIPKQAAKKWLLDHGLESLIRFIGTSSVVRFRL